MRRAVYRRSVQHIWQVTATFVAVIITLSTTLLLSSQTPEPYHTSILSGQGWADELIEGHPDRTRCELGVWKEGFLQLINTHCAMGFNNSKYVQLEEQLVIFHYMSVTGLTIWHTGERFQRSNETILKYFAICLAYSRHHHFIPPMLHFPTQTLRHRIRFVTMRRCGHSFHVLWGLWMVATLCVHLFLLSVCHIEIGKALYLKTVSLLVLLTSHFHLGIWGGRDLQLMPKSGRLYCRKG